MTDKVIKSVRRIFEILELFAQEQRPLPAKEVSKRLDYPLMSTHQLLKSMHQLGYADFDPPTWAYTPSRSFIEVLEWAREYLDRDESILNLISDLNDQTLETVNLSLRVDTQVKIVHGLEGQHPVGVSVKVGVMMPLTHSLTGITALLTLPHDEQELLLRRIEQEDPNRLNSKETELIDYVRRELSDGPTVAGYDFFVGGIGAVCMPVRSTVSGGGLVIGVVGPSDRIRSMETEHRKSLVRLAKKHKVPICNAVTRENA